MVNTGHHDSCCGTSYLSGVQDYGVATTLYFKFVKYLICYFFVFTVLSLPIVFLNIQAYKSNMQENETILRYDSFSDFIVSLKQNVVGSTVGAIGLNSFKCKNGHIG
jgi:hypothetical protein